MAGGLRQQQHGRTRSLGQMPSATLTGGAQGRGQLQHNGMRTTTGGGMNAKGSGMARPAVNPLTAKVADPKVWTRGPGYFQYGNGQWGFINAKGFTDLSAKPPAKGAKVFGWNEITPLLKARGTIGNVPTQQAAPNPLIDDLYARNMAQHDLSLNQAVQGGEYNVKMLNSALEQEKEKSTRQFVQDREGLAASFGAAGLDGGGQAAGTIGAANEDFDTFINNLVTDTGMKVGKERADQGLARTARDTTKAAELGLATDRWKLEHPGAKLPVVRKGLYQENGNWFYANPNTGVVTTFTPPKGAKPVVPAKPKHPNAKTYTPPGATKPRLIKGR